jgi:hypothetical protein
MIIYILNSSIVLLMVILLLIIFTPVEKKKESFNLGVGKSFGYYRQPEDCSAGNNCFKGSYLRSQAYQNVCPPDYGQLTRTKVQLQDGCLRTLGNNPQPKFTIDCHIDNNLERHCNWKEQA